MNTNSWRIRCEKAGLWPGAYIAFSSFPNTFAEIEKGRFNCWTLRKFTGRLPAVSVFVFMIVYTKNVSMSNTILGVITPDNALRFIPCLPKDVCKTELKC